MRDSSPRRRHSRRRSTSKITMKPIAPIMASAVSTPTVVGSSTSRAKLSDPGSMSNPALVNAETAWNTDHQCGLSTAVSPRTRRNSSTAPTPCRNSVKRPMRHTRPFRPPGSPRPMCWPNIRRSRVAVRRPASEKMTMAPTMKPRAPTWISARITIWPNRDQWSWVETTVNPVTQTAEVAVNRATRRSGSWPSAKESGSASRTVPRENQAGKDDDEDEARPEGFAARQPGVHVQADGNRSRNADYAVAGAKRARNAGGPTRRRRHQARPNRGRTAVQRALAHSSCVNLHRITAGQCRPALTLRRGGP